MMEKKSNEAKGREYWNSVIEKQKLQITYDSIKYFEDKAKVNFLKLLCNKKSCLIFLACSKKDSRKRVVKYFFDDNKSKNEWEKFTSVYSLSPWNHIINHIVYEHCTYFFDRPAIQVSLHRLVLDNYISFIEKKLAKNEKDFISCRFFQNKVSLEKEMLIRFFVYQIITALRTAYDMQVVYTDLKPGNIFFDYSGLIKIGDMGGTYDFTFLPLKFSNKLEVTLAYSMFVREENKIIDAATACRESIFSLGVTTYEFCSLGDKFFEVKDVRDLNFEEKLDALRTKLEKIKLMEDITIDFKDFLINMLDPELYRKTNFEKLLKHPWIQGTNGRYLKFVRDELLRVSKDVCDKNINICGLDKNSNNFSRKIESKLLVKDFFSYVLKIKKNDENVFNGDIKELDSLNKNLDKILDEVKPFYELEKKLKSEGKTLDKEKLKERNMKLDAVSKKIDRRKLTAIMNRYIENLKKICWNTDQELKQMVIDEIRERVIQRFENYSEIFKAIEKDLSYSKYEEYIKTVASDLKNFIVIGDLSQKTGIEKYSDYFNSLVDDKNHVVADKSDLCNFADDVVSFLKDRDDTLKINTCDWEVTMTVNSDDLKKLSLENEKIFTYIKNVTENVIAKQEFMDIDGYDENKKSITGLILNYFKEQQRDNLSNSPSLETKSDIKVNIYDDKIIKFKNLLLRENQKESYKIKIKRSRTQTKNKTYIPNLISDKHIERSLSYNIHVK